MIELWLLAVICVLLVVLPCLGCFITPYLLLDKLNEPVLLLSRQGKLLKANRAAHHIRPQLRKAQTLDQLLPAGSEAQLELPVTQHISCDQCGAWGRMRFTRLMITPFPWWLGHRLWMRIIDNSGYQQQISELKLELEWKSAVLDTIPMMLLLKDDRGRFLWLNSDAQSYLHCYKLAPDVTDEDYFTAETVQRHRHWEQRVLMTGIPLQVSEVDEHAEQPLQIDMYIAGFSIDSGRRQRVLYAANKQTHRLQQDTRLQQREQQLRELINAMPQYVLIEDFPQNTAIINRAVQSLAGIPDQVLNVQALDSLLSEESLLLSQSNRDKVLRSRKPLQVKSWMTLANGRRMLLDGHIVPVSEQRSGRVESLICIYDDITDNQGFERSVHFIQAFIENKSQLDTLTGVSNKDAVVEYYQAQWQIEAHSKLPIAVMIVCIDAFDGYNQCYGGLSAERALIQVAQRLRSALYQPRDLVGRYENDRFLVVLPECHYEGCHYAAQRLCQAVLELNIPFTYSASSAKLSISIGVAWCEPAKHQVGSAELLEQAELCLAQAQEQGGNQFVITARTEHQ